MAMYPLALIVFQSRVPNAYLNDPHTVKTLNIGTPRLTSIVVLKIKQFNFTKQ